MTKPKSAAGKEAVSITFDKVVLEKIKEKTIKEHTTVSNLVNHICKQTVMRDETYYRTRAKEFYLKFQEYKYIADNINAQKEMI